MALGAAFSVPGGLGVVEGNEIPYQPEALAKKKENGEHWLTRRSRDQVLHARRAARDLHAVPVPDRPGARRHPDRLRVRERQPDRSHGQPRGERRSTRWMGWSRGRWDGDTLVVDVTGFNDQTWFDRAGQLSQRRAARRRAVHGRRPGPSCSTRRRSRIRRCSRGRGRSACRSTGGPKRDAQLFEYKCVEFAEPVMYGHLSKKPAQEGAAR